MSEKYIQFSKPMKEMSKEELLSYFFQGKKFKKSELLRSIILNEHDHMTITYKRSLRSFWYSTVKPILDKMGLLTESDLTEKSLKSWDADLSKYLVELVTAGELTYKDLNIVDNSRQRENPAVSFETVDPDIFGYKTNIDPYSNIILSTEKDTIYNILRDIARLYGCSVISGKGQGAFSAMEDLLRGIEAKGKDIYILTITDYDPAGYSIANTFKDQVDKLKPILDITGDIHIERLGIYPRQLSDKEVENNKYTPKPDGLDKWFEQTGGINGEKKGLELDAFSPDKIRSIFVTGLKKYIDNDVYKQFIKESYIKRQALNAIKNKFEQLLNNIVELEIENIKLNDIDIDILAQAEYSQFPIDQLCDNNRDKDIGEYMLSHLK